jgi:hypothetical protein
LVVAVLLAGLHRIAGAADPPKPEKPLLPQLPGIEFPDLEDLFKNLPVQIDPEQLKKLREEMKKAQEEFQKAMEQFRGMRGGVGFAFGALEDSRFGVRLDKPTDALTDQLDLPKGRGLVVGAPPADSAAAKAGLKAHDILLELNGKPVPSDAREFAKLLEDIKPNAPVDAVVMRKGKKETVKGLTLPEAKPAVAPRFRILGPGGLPGLPGGGAGGLPGFPGGDGKHISIVRKNDDFTATQKEGGVTLKVTGSLSDGKAKVSEIQVEDGGKTEKYDSLDKVPEKHRGAVKSLIEASQKGEVQLKIR